MNRAAVVRTVAGMVLGVLAVGADAVGVSYAQQSAQQRGQTAIRGRGMMPAGPLVAMRRGLAQLGLSDEQKQQIQSIVEGRKAELKAFRDAMTQARRGVAHAIANDDSELTIRARSAELAKAQADLAVFLAELRKQVSSVLTPEQQSKAKALRLKALARAERIAQRRKKLLEL